MRLLQLKIIGVISGLGLGSFLKLMEQMTSKQVYTLLLNVDYIPVLNSWCLNEFSEFMLHILVSIILVPSIYYSLKQIGQRQSIYTYMLISSLIGAILYVTTSFSTRTPALYDEAAFLLWILGHLLFGWIVGTLIAMIVKD
ncbi:hypothetical protein [Virgibacillus pantothenticus]|uniref:hypothetical protein n=1 Tax=Virgibacillus pantothenticus TaxID=1473 RepID=UPI0009864FED|nr:hypothetical protein [Virgibacillus pantothenticus]